LASDRDLTSALRAARVAEAVHFEAVLGIWDAKSLRLHALREDLKPLLDKHVGASELFDLALVPGEAPRLWIDLISFVEMEPDYRTYRFYIDGEKERTAQFETADRAKMVTHLTNYFAHKLVLAEKTRSKVAAEIESQSQAVEVSIPANLPATAQFSLAAVVYAWISGFILGSLILAIAAILMKKLII
jgi:hypothetical protein